MSNPFLDILKKSPAVAPPRPPALDVLQEFCDGIAAYQPTALSCELVLGHPTNYGQEYRVVITSVRTGYDYTLLRAYVKPLAGPVRVDFYDFSWHEFPDEQKLEDGLKEFLDRPATRAVIDQYAR